MKFLLELQKDFKKSELKKKNEESNVILILIVIVILILIVRRIQRDPNPSRI